MTIFYKYPSSGRSSRGSGGAFSGRPSKPASPNGSNRFVQKTDHKDIIAKAIKQASLKSEHFRSAAADATSGKVVKFKAPENSKNKRAAPPQTHQRKNEKKSGGKRHGGSFSNEEPRFHTYKHQPRLKTGTDKDTLEKQDRLKIIVLGGNEEVGRNMSLIE